MQARTLHLGRSEQIMPAPRARITYLPDYLDYDFGPQHPLRPERITLGLDLLERSGLWSSSEAVAPAPVIRKDLETVHAPDYIRAIEDGSTGWLPAGELARYGLGPGDTPAFTGMHETASSIAGGTVSAALAIMAGTIDRAFNPAGGWHHALHNRAAGFCVYNDAAIAAAHLADRFDARVLYVDFDCHHGDGVQWIFYEDPRVLTVSFHETGRFLFPGTGDETEIGQGPGRGFAVNVPMAPFTQDESWQEAIHAILPDLAARFRPDIIISNHGADTHVLDPITHLSLTTRSFVDQARLIRELAVQHTGGKWLAVGSGGYEWRFVVPRSWAILWATMTEQPLPDIIPADWRHRWAHLAAEPFPTHFVDVPDASPPVPRREEITRLNRQTVDRARRLHGLRTAGATSVS